MLLVLELSGSFPLLTKLKGVGRDFVGLRIIVGRLGASASAFETAMAGGEGDRSRPSEPSRKFPLLVDEIDSRLTNVEDEATSSMIWEAGSTVFGGLEGTGANEGGIDVDFFRV